jgi:RHS repeat-associated protein
MYDDEGKKTWSAELDIYGRVRTFDGRSLKDCPFRYQGQYEDSETGLYYNRFRYYDPSTGAYLSQDPIGLAGNNPTLYSYVKDVNTWIDIFGLDCKLSKKVKIGEEIAPNTTVKRIKPGTNGKAVVIGRSMETRIKPAAKNINAEYWDGFDSNLDDATNLINNEKWLKEKIAEGYTVVDVGLDPTYKTSTGNISKSKGKHYRMETSVVFGTKR